MISQKPDKPLYNATVLIESDICTQIDPYGSSLPTSLGAEVDSKPRPDNFNMQSKFLPPEGAVGIRRRTFRRLVNSSTVSTHRQG
jgi:hypothetical protein